MVEETEEKGLLARWSKRKLEAKKHSDEPTDFPEAAAEPIEATEEPDQPDPILEENRLAAEAIDLDNLNYESDFSVFMKDGVPDVLKRQALKALWRSSPVLANVDGLVDYDDDFANPDLIMKTFDSAWKIGKGYFEAEDELEQPGENAEPGEIDEDAVELASSKPDFDEEPNSEDQVNDGEPDIEQEFNDGIDETLVADADETMEPEPQTPKVSLRKRLMLES